MRLGVNTKRTYDSSIRKLKGWLQKYKPEVLTEDGEIDTSKLTSTTVRSFLMDQKVHSEKIDGMIYVSYSRMSVSLTLLNCRFKVS